MSDALTRKIEELVIQIIAGMDEPEAAIAALIAEERTAARKEGCAWAEAIERWFVNWHTVPDWSAADPWAELHRMICWEQKVALDLAVSEDARKLIAEERARAFDEAAQSVTYVVQQLRLCAAAERALAKKETADRSLPPPPESSHD